jgi:hypothetical protein
MRRYRVFALDYDPGDVHGQPFVPDQRCTESGDRAVMESAHDLAARCVDRPDHPALAAIVWDRTDRTIAAVVLPLDR